MGLTYGQGINVLKKNKKMILNIMFLLLLMAGTLFFVLKDQSLYQIFDIMKDADNRWLYLAVGLVLIFVCSESVIIKYLMKLLKQGISLLHCIKYSFIGFFFSCITPSATGGQPMQIYYMQRDGLDISVSTLVLLIVTVGYKAVLVLIGGVMFLFKGDFILDHLGNVKYIFIYGIVVNLIFITFLVIIIFKESLAKIIICKLTSLLKKIHIVKNKEEFQQKLLDAMRPYHDGAIYIRQHGLVLLYVLIISMIQRCALFLVPWCVFKSFGLSGVSALEIVTLQAVIALSVDMLPLPGGMGAAEKSFSIMFETIFGSAFLVPGMLLSRGISYYFLVIISGIITIFAHGLGKRKKKNINRGKNDVRIL